MRDKIVPPRTTGPDCHCNKECFTNVSDDQKTNLLVTFNNIGDKNKQDTYLAGLIRVNPVIRQRKRDGSRSSKTCSVKYEIKIGLEIIQVCKKAFCSLLGVGKSRVERIINNLKNNVPSPVDKRGKHHSRPNKIPDNICFQLDTFISSFPKRQSHYSRSDNNNVRYMSPELSVAKLYRMYLEIYEPDVYAFLNSENGEQVKPKLKYNYFANYFNRNFNISFGTPRSDTCQTCDNLKKIIDSENNEEEKANLEVEKQIHLRKAEVFYTYLKQLSAEAKQNDSIDVLSFDLQQNMPLPHIPSGDVFYKRQLWSYNFCIHSAGTGKSHFYMYNESSGKKGQNEVISFLHHYFKNKLSPRIKTLYLFSDNCSAQNKNKTLFQYLSAVVNTPTFSIKSIIHRYPEPGHSFLPCDRCFGHIEKVRRQVERVFLPDEYEKMVSETNKKFKVVHVDQSMIFDFNSYLSPLAKKVITNKEKVKFTIMAYRYVEYTNEGIFCSTSGNSTAKEKYTLNKTGEELTINENGLLRLYNEPIKLKLSKFNDVTQLASKYVPQEYQWFYIGLTAAEESNTNNSDGSDYEN